MAREVKIRYAISGGKSNTNLKNTLKYLTDIREAVKDIKKVDLDFGASKLQNAEKYLSNIDKTMTKVANNTATTNKKMDTLGTKMTSVGNKTKSATKEVKDFVGSLALLNTMKRILPSFLALEDSVYNLGVVSKLSVYEIEQLKSTLLDMGSTFPQTATDIAKGADIIVRTGESLESALEVMKSATMLATASGEDLAGVVQIVNKILVAMGIEAEDSAQAMETLHAVAVGTATDLTKVGLASKYWSSALATLSNMSTRSGQDLANYKQELFEFGAVATGVFANVGRDSTMAGTGIRTLTNKMVYMEQTARALFQEDLLNNAVYIDPNTFEVVKDGMDGILMTSEKLSEIALTDFPKAVNLLSDLFNKGIIKLPTIVKMFTGRQGLAIASFLQTIDGDMQGFSETIKEQSNLANDYEKQLSNLNNQLAILSGNFKSLASDFGEDFKNIAELGITATNGLITGMKEFSKEAGFVSSMISGWTTSILTFTSVASLSTVLKTLTGISKPVMLFTNQWIIAGTVIAGTVAWYMKLKKEQEEQIRLQKEAVDKYVNTKKELIEIGERIENNNILIQKSLDVPTENMWDTLKVSLDSYKDSLEEINLIQQNLGGEPTNFTNMIEKYKGMMEDVGKSRYATSNIPMLETEENLKQTNKELAVTRALYTTLKREIGEKIEYGYFVSEEEEDKLLKLEDSLGEIIAKKTELQKQYTGFNEVIKGIASDEEEATKVLIEWQEKLRQELSQTQSVAQKALTTSVKELISKSDFSDMDELLETINKYDEEFGKNIVQFIPENLTKEQSKALANSKDFLTYASALTYEKERINSLTEENKRLNEELISQDNRLVNSSGYNKTVIEATIKQIEHEIAKNNTNLDVLNSQMNIHKILVGLITDQKDEATDIKLPYIELNSELAKAKYNLETFGLYGQEMFSKQKEQINNLYSDLLGKQKQLVLDIVPDVGDINENDLKTYMSKMKELQKKENLTSEDKETFNQYKSAYDAIDKYLSLIYEKRLKLVEVDKKSSDYTKEQGIDLIDNLKEERELRFELKNIGVEREDSEIYLLELEKKALEIQKDNLSELMTEKEISELNQEISNKELEIEIKKAEYKQQQISLDKEITSEITSRQYKLNNYYNTSSANAKYEFDMKRAQLNDQIQIAVEQGNLVLAKEVELEREQLITAEKIRQKEEANEQAGIIMNMMSSIASGQGLSYDFSGELQTGIATMLDSEANFSDLSGSQQFGAVMGVADVLSDFMNLSYQSEMNSLSKEQAILELRIQGAETEEEKTALQEEQLELAKEQLELQYEASTSFMGISGTLGSGLSSMASGAMMGSSFGVQGALIGAGVGLFSGLLSGMSGETELRNQQNMLESQYNMEEYLEDIATYTSTTNDYMETLASETSSLGIAGAQASALESIVGSGETIGGAGTSTWYDTYQEWQWSGVKSGWETVTDEVIKNASAELSDYSNALGEAYEASDLLISESYNDVVSQINEDIDALAWVTTSAYDSARESHAEAMAEYEALVDLLEEIESVVSTYEEMAPKLFTSYFGAVLETMEDESGEVYDYLIDWTDMTSTLFSEAYSSALGNLSTSTSSAVSSFFSGISNIFIQNYSSMSDVIENIEDSFESLASAIAEDSENMNMDEVEESMIELIGYMDDLEESQTEINELTQEYLDLWIENGGEITDIYDTMTDSMTSIYDAMESAFDADDYEDMASTFGESIGTLVTDSLIDTIINENYADEFSALNTALTTAISTGSISDISSLVTEANALSAQLDADRQEVEAIASMFDLDSNTEYVSDSQNIEYTSGTTQDVVYNVSITVETNVGNYLADEEAMDEFVNEIASQVEDAVDKYN